MERRHVKGITIDSEQTRDIDDAIWIEEQPDGWHIIVSIADVAEAILPESEYDTRAREMVTTKYFGTGNSPMLPRRFAEDELSLWPNRERHTVTVELTVKLPEMEIVKTEVYPSTLKSQGRITYDKIPVLLQEKPKTPEYDVISLGCKMAMQLLDRRRKAGAFVLYDLNNGWVTTEEGFLRQLEKKEETIGYIFIQEMMVLANSQVAEFAVKNNIPVPFRNHMAMSAMPDRQVLMAQIQDALTTPMADLDVVRQRTHMLLGRASYAADLLGHYGLNLPAYLHFTSPIRRYADLVTQRQIKAHLDGKPLPYTKEGVQQIAHHINDTLELERERANRYFKNRDEEKAQRAIDARRLDGLDATQFERVTKIEVRSGGDPSDGFEDAYLRRLKESRLPLIALTLVLTLEGATEGWRPLRQATIDQLVKRPADAISVLAQAQTIVSWPATSYTVTHAGPAHARTFTAEASLPWENETVVGHGGGATAKLAKQFAAIDLLAKLGGNKVPTTGPGSQPTSFQKDDVVALRQAMSTEGLVAGVHGVIVHVHDDTYDVEFITPTGRKVVTVVPNAIAKPGATVVGEQAAAPRDPVSMLMDHVAKARIDPPAFTFEKTGPDHVPVITCTCRMGNITRTAKAGSKQDAKKQAAAAMCHALRISIGSQT